MAQKNFNRTCKKRRPWQDGTGNLGTYVFSSNLVVRRAGVDAEKLANFPYEVHPWIQQATKENPGYVANPHRPRIFDLVNGELRDIKDCSPPYLAKGDIVWISFAVELLIGASWASTFIPYEIVRVGKVSSELIGAEPNTANAPTAPLQGLTVGLKVPISKFISVIHHRPF